MDGLASSVLYSPDWTDYQDLVQSDRLDGQCNSSLSSPMIFMHWSGLQSIAVRLSWPEHYNMVTPRRNPRGIAATLSHWQGKSICRGYRLGSRRRDMGGLLRFWQCRRCLADSIFCWSVRAFNWLIVYRVIVVKNTTIAYFVCTSKELYKQL